MDTSRTVPLSGEALTITGHAPTVWQHANFAEDWYRDAKREAQGTDGRHSTRREIIFAASFLESYVFEWVRQQWFERINDYFPPTARFKNDPLHRATLKAKWSLVPSELHRAGLIPIAPALDLADLGTLVVLRNGLLHARASRPATTGQADAARPRPALCELEVIGHSWAVGVARDLVIQLHLSLGTVPPAYL